MLLGGAVVTGQVVAPVAEHLIHVAQPDRRELEGPLEFHADSPGKQGSVGRRIGGA